MLVLATIFLDMITLKKKQQSKNELVGLHQTKCLLQSKRKDQQNEKAIYRMGENIKMHI